MKKILKIRRQDPEKNNGKSYFQEFTVDLDGGTSLLLAFHHIREHTDPSLAIRSSCRAAVCGSCAALIDGRPRLACKSLLQDFKGKKILIEPLPSYPVIKDLVIDLEEFFRDYKELEPWLQTDSKVTKEFIQTIEEREHLDPYANCILCGVCQGACPVREKSPREFLGPALLAKAWRFIADSRDQATAKRLKKLKTKRGIYECDQFAECGRLCPREITGGKVMLLARHYPLVRLIRSKKKSKKT